MTATEAKELSEIAQRKLQAEKEEILDKKIKYIEEIIVMAASKGQFRTSIEDDSSETIQKLGFVIADRLRTKGFTVKQHLDTLQISWWI